MVTILCLGPVVQIGKCDHLGRCRDCAFVGLRNELFNPPGIFLSEIASTNSVASESNGLILVGPTSHEVSGEEMEDAK